AHHVGALQGVVRFGRFGRGEAQRRRAVAVVPRGDDARAALVRPAQRRLVQGARYVGDAFDADVEQQVHRVVHAVEVLVRQRDHLEAAGIGAVRRIVLGEPGEVVGALEGPPAGDRGLELPDQALADVYALRAPRRPPTLLPA